MQEKIALIVEKTVRKILSPYPITPAIEVVNYIREAVEKIVSGIIQIYQGKDVAIDDAIEDLMRYLATDRNFSPSESVRIIGDLRKEIARELNLKDKEALKLFEIIENAVYKAFDAYYACRSKIFELRLKEKDRDIEILRRIIEFSERAEKENNG
uniref:Uncharacterized protein n=1 Tax=Archaeoglobus fulgidus TaxID=2234 RepID=A0A7J2TLB8_ARCFL